MTMAKFMRVSRIDELNGHSLGSHRPMVTALKRYNGGWVLVFVVGAFAEMPGGVSRIVEITAHDLVPGVDPRKGAAMPTDDHDSRTTTSSIITLSERGGGLCRRLGAQGLCYCFLDPTPSTEGERRQ